MSQLQEPRNGLPFWTFLILARDNGPYGYDLEELIARARARHIKRIHQATEQKEVGQKKKEPRRAS
jgi:hypothetical protein